MALTMGDVRKAVSAMGDRGWTVRADLPDDVPIPDYATGGEPERQVPAAAAPALDLVAAVSGLASNPLLLRRRLNLGLIDPPMTALGEPPNLSLVESGKARPGSVDWRNRWGTQWLTTIQNQNPCHSCWAFAAAALVETMVRIEHGAWAKRSEGDLRDGWGVAEQNWQMNSGVAPCAHGAGEGDALDYVVRRGIADPSCYPWRSRDHAYTPTPDRDGRTVTIDRYQRIGGVEEQKQWLDAVGPIAAFLIAYADLKAYGAGGVYRKSAWEEMFSNGEGHVVLVVGYDDAQQCWIIRNSWGTLWGEAGYGLIAYGEVGIDDGPKYGVQTTNPDPWTKRRLHNGCVLESGNGPSHQNFEMVRPSLPRVAHIWRAGGENGDFSWHDAGSLEDPNDVGAGAGCMGYPTLIATTFGRNLECVYWEISGRLRHWYFDQGSKRWIDGGRFGPNDVQGYPGFIQSNYGAPGNFELVVRCADGRLHHWWRENAAAFAWHDGGTFASGVRQTGPSLVQSQLGARGNFDVVCVLDSGGLQHWWRDNDRDGTWKRGSTFGQGVGDTPVVMIEGGSGASDEKTPGNFELCVAVNGQVQHWWRNSAFPERDLSGLAQPLHPPPADWIHSATFGQDVKHVWGLVQGSFGGNLEVVVERTDGVPQHYWRDGGGWHDGAEIAT